MTEETITNLCYTKEQVDAMVAEAVKKHGELMKLQWQNIILRQLSLV